MGQNVSKSLIPPPLTLQDCLVNGKVDLARSIYYRRQQDYIVVDNLIVANAIRKKRKLTNSPDLTKPRNKRSRSVKKHSLLVRNPDGSLRQLTSEDTLWFLLYCDGVPQNNRLKRKFRNRFRMPHESFIELHDTIIDHEMFSLWKSNDAAGLKPSNTKLLLLGALRYIGRGWTFDDIEEATAISRETNRRFFLKFIEYGSSVLYKKYVLDLSLNGMVAEHERLFNLAGFNGCIGSTDATHIGMLNCAAWAHILHKGFKLCIPSRTYNMTVAHTRQILGSTCGHPATYNDKTLIMFDELVSNVNDGSVPDNFEFMLYEYDKNGEVVKITYKGVWFMVDNGYLSWSCTVPPVKDGTSYKVIRFSEWLESMRKDVECTFGILKGRFCILQYGLRFAKVEHCYQTWLTCCALHNMLLFVDGLHKNWEVGGVSDWETMNMKCGFNNANKTLPFAIARLNRDLNETCSKVKVDDMELDGAPDFKKYTCGNKRIVSKMPLSLFQQCLVNHFDIRFKQKSITWPRHIKLPQVM